ncbi:MAG: hypothetical protein AAB914_00435 [Patescibacteria group bacterium]
MIFLIVGFLLICFTGIVLVGAPYVPSKRLHIEAGLDLLSLRKGQTLVELGSGDGRVIRQAAKRGINCVGYELNPILYLISLVYCYKYRKNIQIKLRNYWLADLSDADGVFVFLAGSYMKKLDKKMLGLKKPVKLVSVGFMVPGKKPVMTKSAVHLYKY